MFFRSVKGDPEAYVIRKHVRLGVSLYAVERAETAEFLTDVCIVDIAVDDVADYAVRVKPLTQHIGGFCQVQKIRMFKDFDSFLKTDSVAPARGVQNRINRSHINS